MSTNLSSAPRQNDRPRLDRRVVLKASAAFGAMAIVGSNGHRARPAIAQEAAGTLAGTWVEADQLGTFSAASTGESLSFQADLPFYAAAPHWSAEAAPGSSVEMSFSANGTDWTDSVAVYEAAEDAGQPELEGRRFGQLLAADGASYIRYQGIDPDGNATSLPGLAFTYIDATAGPTVDDVYNAALQPTVAPPPIISRADWGANESYRFNKKGLEIWPPEYQEVEHVIIHHTDTTNFQDPLIAIRSIYYYHAVTRGWGDIGYNYLVDFMGNVYEGRVGGDNVVGGHAYQYAHGSSGIGTMGRFAVESETPETLAGLVWITAWTGRYLDALGFESFHEKVDLPTICGHRDVNASTCPGDQLYADLPTIRDYVNEILTAGADPAPDPAAFAEGDTVVTNAEGVNLRETPGLDGRVLVQMALGEVLTVLDGPTTTDGYAWYEVKGSNRIGWAASTFLEKRDGTPPPPAPAAFAVGDTVRVDTDSLNLRSAAGVSASVVATLATNTQGTIQAGPQPSGGYTWYQLTTSSGSGWSAGEFLVLATGEPPPPPASGQFAVGDAVVVDTDLLNLRSQAGLSQPVAARLPNGSALTISQAAVQVDGYTWYGITSAQYGTGWVVQDFLSDSSSGGGISVGSAVRVIDGTLNLRSAPGTAASVVAVLPDGAQLSVTGGPTDASGYTWWQVASTAYGAGWAAGAFLQTV